MYLMYSDLRGCCFLRMTLLDLKPICVFEQHGSCLIHPNYVKLLDAVTNITVPWHASTCMDRITFMWNN